MKFYWRKYGNNYLSLIFTDKKKEVFIKCKEFWDKIKNLIKKINDGKAGMYEEDFMKIKFNSDDK